MPSIVIPPAVLEAVQKFKLPSQLGFGQVAAPAMINCEYKDGKWGELELLPYGPISMAPTCKVLHYAQEIFEGMKAYGVEGQGPYLFRPLDNARRMNLSAERMAMPPIPTELFMHAVSLLSSVCRPLIPRRTGESLYLRPFMFASEEGLGIKPSERFRFMVIASPCGPYIVADSMRLYVERKEIRAAPGGTGHAKTGGNYARSLLSTVKARELGLNQSLWLDAKEHRFVEELSGMNFFALIGEDLFTPPVSETILNGITRDSLIRLARDLGVKVREEPIEINQLLAQIKSGECPEAFACGTAAIVTPVSVVGEADGTILELKRPQSPMGQKLKKALLDIQEGRVEDHYGWRVPLSATPSL